MVEILVDSLKDTAKAFPVIFIILLIVEFFMVKLSEESDLLKKRFAKLDPIGGGGLGLIPQCGIPVGFANLYSSGHITLGMLLAIFLSSSDEALIIIGAYPGKLGLVAKILFFKLILGILAGYLTNLLIKEKRNRIRSCGVNCKCPKCTKTNNIFLSSLFQTLKISVFLVLTVFLLNLGIEKIGEAKFNALLGQNSYWQPIYAALIGSIPSCFSSVVLAEGYVKESLSFGALMAGLTANTGYGILIIFRELPLKKAFLIFSSIIAVSILVGEVIYYIGM